MKNFSLYLYLITGATILILHIPFLILLNQQDPSYGKIHHGTSLKGSSLSVLLKNSTLLITAQTCIIVGVLPMILDIALDFHHLKNLSAIWADRCMIVVILIVPSVTFLIFHESWFMPMLYVVQFLSQNMLFPTVMIHSVYRNTSVVSPVFVPALCLLALSIFGVCCVSEAYAILFDFDDAPFRLAGSNVFMVSSWVIALCVAMLALYKMWKTGKFASASFKFEKLVPVVSFVISAIAALTINKLFHAATWRDVGEECLVGYAFIQLVFSLFMTVLPGRVARLDAEVRMESLILKGIFVRYISHEIRSPLNVVVSGLEFLKDEVKALSGSLKDRVECLIHEMTVASKSAVHILTDVLDYELIDSGMLKLNLRWFPLALFLENKLKWAEIVASTKNIKLVIEDHTVSMTAGLRSLCEKNSRDSGSAVDGIDIEEGVLSSVSRVREAHGEQARDLPPFARSFLHVDDSKIEQFLLNVVTNAINSSPMGGTVIILVDFLPMTGSVLSLSTSADEVMGMLRIEVRDSGKGFEAEDQEKIAADFLRFNGQDLQGEGNVGLGLWIAQGIVKLHQGCFNLYSDGIEHGCRIVAEIPLYLHPKTPLPAEDQINYSKMLCAMEEMCDRVPVIHDKVDDAADSTDLLPSIVFVDSDSKVVLPGNIDSPSFSGRRTSFKLTDSSNDLAGPAQEPVLLQKYIVVNELNIKEWEVSPVKHGKMCADTAKDSKDSDGRENLAMTAKPSSDKNVAASGDAPRSRRTIDGLRFLIVDDSAVNRKIIRRILEGESKTFTNAVIEEADDGTSAVSTVQSILDAGSTFDFIFMDFVMVNMNGPEAVQILRNRLKFNRTIIGVTGNALPADMALFRASGVDQILLKPLNRAQFVSELLLFVEKLV